jgi:hypothetical protein
MLFWEKAIEMPVFLAFSSASFLLIITFLIESGNGE